MESTPSRPSPCLTQCFLPSNNSDFWRASSPPREIKCVAAGLYQFPPGFRRVAAFVLGDGSMDQQSNAAAEDGYSSNAESLVAQDSLSSRDLEGLALGRPCSELSFRSVSSDDPGDSQAGEDGSGNDLLFGCSPYLGVWSERSGQRQDECESSFQDTSRRGVSCTGERSQSNGDC